MNHIDVSPSQRKRNRDVIAPTPCTFRLVQLHEVSGKRAQFMEVAMRTNQQVFIPVVDCRKIPNEIPDVRTYTELVDFPDIDCDPH
jgi:hypothetical protein